MKRRIDEWTDREDKFLAMTIIDYIRNGKTQLQAFSDVAEKIDRSAAGCQFRWNSCVRKEYTEEIRIARRIRRGQPIK